MSYTLGELANKIDAELQGDADCIIEGIATITSAQAGQLTFLSNRQYKKYLSTSNASAVILSEKDSVDCPIANLLISNNPQLSFCRVIELFFPENKPASGIDATASVAKSATISTSAYLGPSCVIGNNSRIGNNVVIHAGTVIEHDVVIEDDTLLYPNVTICRGVQIGKNVIIHPGAVIGADGFGLANDNGVWHKIPQIGSVIIENDVEIGANTTIDRGAIDNTIIKSGVKIDNQIQIGHNCYIGEHTAIAACTGVSGSTKIGKRCMIGGGSGFNGHITVCDDVILTGNSMVAKSIKEPGVYSSGLPLNDNLTWRKNIARFNNLNDMAKRISVLEKKIEK